MLARLIFLIVTITVALAGRANAGDEARTTLEGLGILLWLLYFLPSIIALCRRHRNLIPIIVLNVFLGWTILGWIIALIWCFTADTEPRRLMSAPMSYGPPPGWQGYQTPPSGISAKEYRGYAYFVDEDGQARLGYPPEGGTLIRPKQWPKPTLTLGVAQRRRIETQYLCLAGRSSCLGEGKVSAVNMQLK